MRAKGKSDDKAATKEEFKYLRRMGEEAASRGIHIGRLNRMSALPFTTPPRWCK